MVTPLLHVALGGAAGAVLRALCLIAVARINVHDFPFGTLAVNVAGSFAMGMLVVLLAPHLRPLVLTGLLGGFTTFSAFSLDAMALWDRGAFAQAAVYVAASVLLSLAAVVTGAMVARVAR